MMLRRAIVPLLALFLLLPLKAQLNTERIMLIGRNALFFEDYVLSIQYFNKVIESKPFLHEPYFFRGLAKYYLDDFKGAEEDFDEAIGKNPYVSRNYQLRGMCRTKLDSITGAMSDFRKAIKYDPQNPMLWQNLAATAMQGERWESAAEIVDSLLLFAPHYTVATLMRAHIAMELGDSVMAVRMADRAVALDAYSCEVYDMRAYVNSKFERYEAAEEDITRSIELMPGRGGGYLNRALIRYYRNNLRGAMEDYDMALYIEPASFVGHYNRGLLRMQVGDDNRAIEDFDFVLNIDEDGWYHVACTWHVTVSTLADEYHEVAMTVLNADMKINMDMSHENSQWRAFAIDRYLVKGSKVRFKFVTNGADGKFKSWLETVSVHRNAAVVGPNFEDARECTTEEMHAWLEEVNTHDPQP